MVMEYQQDAFSKGKSTKEIRIEESKKILMDYGYKIVEPLEVNKSVKDIPDLRKYFYAKLWNKYPDRMQYYTERYKEEIKIVRDLVESREGNTNRDTAIQECVAIIDTIFDYEEEFKLEKPIISINILRVSWVIGLAISILNLEKNKEEERARDKMIDEIEDQYMKDHHKSILKSKAEKLDKILAGMKKNNGEK
jgi:hypothetical protein